MSGESGRTEVYVRSFPVGSGKWQISDGGGADPRWSENGRELYFRTDDGLMVASVEASSSSLRAGKPRSLISGDYRGGIQGLGVQGFTFSDYDATGDGQRFVLFPRLGDGRRGHVTLVTRWFDDLEKIATPSR